MVRAALQNDQVGCPKVFQRQCTRPSRVVVRAKLISKSVIPAFIQRNEMMDQLDRWMEIEVKNEGISNFGMACSFEPVRQDDDLWGFKIHMERVCSFSVQLMSCSPQVKPIKFHRFRCNRFAEHMIEVSTVTHMHRCLHVLRVPLGH